MIKNTHIEQLLHKAQPLDNSPLDEKSPDFIYDWREPVVADADRQKAASLFSRITKTGEKKEDPAGNAKLYYKGLEFVITVSTKEVDSLERTALIWTYGKLQSLPDSDIWVSDVTHEMEFIAKKKIGWGLVDGAPNAVKNLLRQFVDEKKKRETLVIIGLLGIALVALLVTVYLQLSIFFALSKQAIPRGSQNALITMMIMKDLALVLMSGTVVYIAKTRHKI